MVFREDNRINYTKVSNELLKDKELSLPAKGLLITMFKNSSSEIFPQLFFLIILSYPFLFTHQPPINFSVF